MTYVGQSVPRLEDRPLLTGAGRFAADVSFPGQLHMRVVRSQVAHGRLVNIDTDKVAALPEVTAVWTGRDVAEIPPISFRMMRIEGLEPYRQPILARDTVRYVGEPIAVVFAEDPYVAEDADDLVEADIEELSPCLQATDEPGEFAPSLSTEVATIEKGYGDVDAAFRDCHKVVELEAVIGRQSGTPLETRGAIARWDSARGILEVHGAAKVPHYNRTALADMLGLPLEGIHLFEGHVGGGFGIRGELYPEDVLVALAALRLGRPIKWIEDRREHLLAANHSRDQVHRVRAAIDERGFILGLDVEFWVSQGGYIRTHGVTVSDLTAAMLPGPYIIPAYRARGHVRLTNKTPCGTYRAPGRFESTFVRERLLDKIASELARDRLDVRRRNFIAKDDMPFVRGFETLETALSYDSGDYAGLVEQTLTELGVAELTAEVEQRRGAGEMVGLGYAFFVEKSGLGPADGVRISIDDTGQVEIVTGAASLGQGIETVLAQIGADGLGVAIDDVRVHHGQTNLIAHGMGAFASRVTAMTGSAVHIAALRLRREILETAAGLLQVEADELEIIAGRVHATGGQGGDIALAEVATAQLSSPPLSDGGAEGLTAEGWFKTNQMNYPYGFHVALVCIDRATGGVAVERFIIGYDIGCAVNPALVDGQLVGGAAQGIGGALMEAFVYDEAGQPSAASFVDYLIPTVAEMPPVEVHIFEDAPSPINPLGVKGAGEGGVNAVGAAIASAIDDALQQPGAITELPITPERIRALITDRSK